MKKYDYLVVGSGLYGAVFAREVKKAGKSVLVIDKRPNIAGNVYTEDVEVFAYDVICELAKAAHLLKNRPWKQSWVPTNVPMFTEYMSRAYYSFIRLFVVAGLNSTDVFEIYFKKAQVNQHRQETGY